MKIAEEASSEGRLRHDPIKLPEGRQDATGRPTSSQDALREVSSKIATIEQTLGQLGENYLKLYASNFPLLDCKGVAKQLNRSEATIRRWTDKGIIHCYAVPSERGKPSYLYNAKRLTEDLEAYLREAKI